MNASETIKRIAFSKAYEFLDRDPEQNFSKMLEWMEKLGKNGFVARQLPVIRRYAGDPNSNWNRLAFSLWNDVDSEVRKTMFSNFMLNGNLLENQQLTDLRKDCGCNIPWAIMMTPTSAGNRSAAACDTAEKPAAELTFDEMDDIIMQGKALGTYFYVFSGGEPLLKKEDLIALCNKNADCVFLCVTDGLLIDDEFARQLLRVRNMIPLIRVNGLEQETDRRSGSGTFQKIHTAMEILRRHRLLFGIYCCCDCENCEDVTSEQFFNMMIEWGAKGAFFLPYVPKDAHAAPEKMLSAKQRELLIHRLQKFRNTKPLMTLDPCCNTNFTNGCVAGGRGLFHIAADGAIEPCMFFHCSDSNIHEKTLLEACKSPLFRRFYDCQPFDENPFRPCPILDHPETLSHLADGTQNLTDMQDMCQCCEAASETWKEPAAALWQELQERKA
ncbi:MAG: radical SAM protein [Oscillibacter sp.]|nr:radical SAM protein [Oscillibacter sp.]